jgi:hypothetical protein
MCVIVANIMEQCSLFLSLQRGVGPMALMLWLDDDDNDDDDDDDV